MREQRAVRVRCLRRHVDRRLPRRRIDVGDAAAALERRGMAARVEGVERDDLVRVGERLLRRALVARLPVVDVVVGLSFLLVADQHRAFRERLLRRRDRLQRLVVDLDQLERVLGDVRILGDDRRHLLALVADLVGGEHRLRVAGERRHPREVVRGHQLAGDDGDHTRQRCSRRRVDRRDARMRVRAAQDLHVQHPRQDDVVDVVALAADEAGILLALDGVAEPANFGGRHRQLPSRIVAPALFTALTMFW